LDHGAFEGEDEDESEVLDIVSGYIQVLLYLRNIGAEDLLVFTEKPGTWCQHHFTKLDAARETLVKKAGVSIGVGALATTCGLLTANPLMITAGVGPAIRSSVGAVTSTLKSVATSACQICISYGKLSSTPTVNGTNTPTGVR
jgi:hypothetical protein